MSRLVPEMANHLNYTSIFVILILIGLKAYAVPYDYSYTAECLAKPPGPQYKGGIVVNPELNQGLEGWTPFGDANIRLLQSNDANNYIVASHRNLSYHSFSQQFHLDKDKLYTFSAWLQVSNGSADIAAVLKTANGSSVTAGWVSAREGCWSMLKGGFVVDVSGPAHLYLECDDTSVDIWADSISLQPFTQEEWKSHQDLSIEKARKTRVRFQAVDQHGRPITNATVSINLRQSHFPFGCAINQNILYNTAYQNWFSSRFKYTVFENELKWYSNERSRGVEDYSISDAMVGFARSRGISIRGHNVFWEDPARQPSWLYGLSSNDLNAATSKRIWSVMGRYKGQLFHWDVLNENLHFNFFDSKLGARAPFTFHMEAHKIDPSTTPFLNEYNTIEESRDAASSPAKYLDAVRQLRKRGYSGPLGIGVQGHFRIANLPYTRSAIDDILATAGLPIWVTELDVKSGPNQAAYLEQNLRELQAHPAVQGIMMWSAWSPQGCYAMCLTDNNFRNLATGDVVDRFRNSFAVDANGSTDADGFFETSLFFGEYEAKVTHPSGNQLSDVKVIRLAPNEEASSISRFTIEI